MHFNKVAIPLVDPLDNFTGAFLWSQSVNIYYSANACIHYDPIIRCWLTYAINILKHNYCSSGHCFIVIVIVTVIVIVVVIVIVIVMCSYHFLSNCDGGLRIRLTCTWYELYMRYTISHIRADIVP